MIALNAKSLQSWAELFPAQSNYYKTHNETFHNTEPNDVGLPVMVASNVLTAVGGYYHSLLIKRDGSFWAMGYNAYGELGNGTTNNSLVPVPIPGMTLAWVVSGTYAYYTLAVGSPRVPAITGITQNYDGSITLGIAGFPGYGYQPEAATNLSNHAGARALSDFLLSPKVQNFLQEFGRQTAGNHPLFYPVNTTPP